MASSKAERRAHRLFPSKDVDVATAVQLFEWSHYRFARSTETLSPEASAQVLAALVKKRPNDPGVLFLQTAGQPWKTAVNTLKGFQSQYAWGSVQKRTLLTAVAKSPALLAAVQAAAVGAPTVPDAYLAVLVIDGSADSVDALMPHFVRAKHDPTQLDGLERVTRFAPAQPSRELATLLTQVKEHLHQRTLQSPPSLLAQRLGIASGKRFRVQVRIASVPKDLANLDIMLDDAEPVDHWVWLIAKAGSTTFDAHGNLRDTLQLGRCSLDDLPQWLAGAQTKLGLRWKREGVSVSYLKGARLETFLDWLLGPSQAAPKTKRST